MSAEKYQRLLAAIRACGSAVTAFSGGVDSSLVAYLAHRELGPRALAVTSGSASLSRDDLALTRELAAAWGLAHRLIETDELRDPHYAANPSNRCYYCKTTLYGRLRELATAGGYAVLLNGTNADDLGDHRPGLQAAAEHGVRAPLADCGLTKADVRALAAHLGLDNAHKPQAACLSSRVPYGQPISADLLARIDAAEALLRRLGFGQLRVRTHGDVARIEVPPGDLTLVLARRTQIDAKLRSLGYRYVTLDLQGFRSGSLNEGLAP